MREFKKHLMLWLAMCLTVICGNTFGQTINAAYVKALYAKYPTVKSDFCPACKLWVNPYYKSIADTQLHMPLVEYQLLTKEHYALTKVANIPRKGVYASWHAVLGQPNEDNVYSAANKAKIGVKAKGHVNAWILNAWCGDAAILSDTYTFNAAIEEQNQNVGTEIATENITRKLLVNSDVEIWGGTFGSQATYTDGKITNTEPAIYWKIIKANGISTCYLMPNLKTETQARLPTCVVTYSDLVKRIGFDPCKIL